MRDVCKNGHDLRVHGKIVDTKRGMSTRCMECHRATKNASNARRRARRVPRPKPTVCRNGHPLEGNTRVIGGYERCVLCRREYMARYRGPE